MTPPPVFVGGSPSSGSSLLMTVLCRHPELVGGTELNLYDHPEIVRSSDAGYRAGIRTWLTDGLNAPFEAGGRNPLRDLEGYPWSRSEIVGVALDASGLEDLSRRFWEPVLEQGCGTRWVEKTPANVFTFPKLAVRFPGCALVHITRDGRDAMSSLVNRGFSPYRAASRWLCSTVAGLGCRSMPGYTEIRYEDLVDDPERTVSSLCRSLGLDFDPAMLRPDTASAAPRHESWSLSHTSAISDSAVGRFREGADPSLFGHLASVRLTPLARRHHRRLGTDRFAASTGAELLAELGHATRGVEDADRLGVSARLAAYDEVLRFHRHRIRLFRRPGTVSTRLAR